MIKNYLSHFLPVLLALDLIIPFLLAPFYKDYNHLTQVMSVLGNSKAPLHSIYNIWLVAFGVAILISTLQLYPTVAQVSSSISIMLFSAIVIYAVGGCILSGIFSVGETKSLETLSAKIHGYGSVIGFLLLTLAPLFVGLYFFKVSNGLLGILSLICFMDENGWVELNATADGLTANAIPKGQEVLIVIGEGLEKERIEVRSKG